MSLTLLRPEWLLALVPLGVFGWWLLTRRAGLGDWSRAADPALLRAMAALGRIDTGAGRAPLWALLGAVALIVLALAGPAVERRDAVSFRNLDGVLFVLDASDSVTGGAAWPGVQTAGRFALAALGTRPAGLIVYAGDAYMAADMTLDHRQLGQTWSLVAPGMVPDAGSRPERALALAAERLEAAQVIAGDVILFTDGDGLGPASLRQAARIAGTGARLSVVTPGAPGAAAETLADTGQGRAFATRDDAALAAWLGAAARDRLEAQDFPLLFWRDLGRWVLALALLPLLLLFRRPA